MEKLSATFFDGRTSKPNPIWLSLKEEALQLFWEEGNLTPFASWELSDCRLDSFNSSSIVQLSHTTENVSQQLEIKSPPPELRAALKVMHTRDRFIFEMIFNGKAFKLVTGGILVLSLLVLIYVKWVSVFVGNTIVSLIPFSLETAIGNKAFDQYHALLSIDDEKTVLLNDFYRALDYPSDYKVEAYYCDDEIMNAFALPGGKIVVYGALIDETNSWQELAALFSHELMHIEKRHTMRIMARQLGNYAVFSVLTGDMAGITSVILESALTMNELVYTRSFEKEADMAGLELLIKKEITPIAMRELFGRLLKESNEIEEALKHLEVLSTHPLTEKRMAYIEEYLAGKEMLDFHGEENPEAEELWKRLKAGSHSFEEE